MLLNVQPEVRKFILTTVAACVAIWGGAFELGVWGEIFYQRLFNTWVISLAVVLSIWLLPGKQAPVNLVGKIAIAFPTIWLFLAFTSERIFQISLLDLVLFWVGIIISVLCLPYFIFVLVSLLDAEPLSLERRLFLSMIIITAAVAILGYLLGSNHQLLLTCQDFAIAGDAVPTNCMDR